MILKIPLSLELSICKQGNYLVQGNVGQWHICGPTACLRAQKAKLSHAFGRAEGAQSSEHWGLREARSSGQQEVPRTSPRSSLSFARLPPLHFVLQEANAWACPTPHPTDGRKHPTSTDKKPWTNLNKKVFAAAKKLWSRVSLRWKCTRKTTLHNTLCSVGALISFCWLKEGQYAGFLVAKMQRPYSFLADIVLGQLFIYHRTV